MHLILFYFWKNIISVDKQITRNVYIHCDEKLGDLFDTNNKHDII